MKAFFPLFDQESFRLVMMVMICEQCAGNIHSFGTKNIKGDSLFKVVVLSNGTKKIMESVSKKLIKLLQAVERWN